MVSVVIPAYNEELLIAKCLNAFVNQETNIEFEVILVDNNSSDKTAQTAKTFSKHLNLHIVQELKRGRGAARKTGFEKARGEIILSTDSDTIVPRNWINALIENLKNSDAVAVTGTSVILDQNSITNATFNLIQPLSMRMYGIFFRHYWLTGCNFAIYKSTYDKSGGFNENLNVQEDTELSFRVAKLGKIKFIPNIPVVSSGRRFEKGAIKGFLPYLFTYLQTFFIKNRKAILFDKR